MDDATQVRNFVFTINNWDHVDVKNIEELGAKYVIWGEEVGESGTPHLQGYAEMKSPTRFKTLKNKLPRAHIEKRKGTAKEAADYCKKDGKFKELGEPSSQGDRKDLKAIAEDIKTKGLKNAIDESPDAYIKYHRGMEKLAEHYETRVAKKEAPEVIWCSGKSGSGKSKWAYETYPDAWWSSNNLKWFDGYRGHTAVIFDDFRPEQVEFTFLLRLLDRYPLKVPVKGGFVDWIPETIVITSPKGPATIECYNEDFEQIRRRITKRLHFESPDRGATEVPG